MLHVANPNDGRARTPSCTIETDPRPNLTRNQKMVYQKLTSLKRAAGAYELLDLLRSDGVNAIPTIYRALNELEYKGLVLHLASTKSFVALDRSQLPEDNKIQLVCEQCHTVVPIAGTGILSAIQKNAEQSGFQTKSKYLEIVGICGTCRAKNKAKEI